MLAELNFLKTGYTCDGLLDVHIITDEDIANKNPSPCMWTISTSRPRIGHDEPEKVKS
jgi:hypothetical protein